MNHPTTVCVPKTSKNLVENVADVFETQHFPVQKVGQAKPVHKLKGDVQTAAFRRTEVVDGRNIGMRKRRHRARLAHKAPTDGRVLAELGLQHLQGDRPT